MLLFLPWYNFPGIRDKRYGIKGFGNDSDRLKEQFDSLSLSSSSWSNVCSLNIEDKSGNIVNCVFISISRVEESLLLVTIKSIPSENFKYKYYQAIKMQKVKYPILHSGSIKNYIMNPGFTDYPYNAKIAYESSRLIDWYRKTLDKIFKRLKMESLISIPLSVFVCFVDGPLAEKVNRNERLKSWNRLGLVDRESSIISDDEKKFYLINGLSTNNDISYCFVDTTRMLLDDFFSEYSAKLFTLQDDIQIVFVWNLIKDSIINRIYLQLNEIREDIYKRKNGWRILQNRYLNPYSDVISNKYIFERVFENNNKVSNSEAKWYGIDKIRIVDIFSRTFDFNEYMHSQILYKTKRIRKIIKDITFAIEGYKSIRNDRSNLSIQIWLFVLTIITIIIGIIQILITIA